MSEEITTEPEAKPAAKKRAPRKTAAKPADTTSGVLDEVRAERARQDEQWGEQNHPLIGGASKLKVAAQEYERTANSWKQVNKTRARLGLMGWDSVAAEELFEALAERDPAAARAEYVQLAAVAVAAIESIDRNHA